MPAYKIIMPEKRTANNLLCGNSPPHARVPVSGRRRRVFELFVSDKTLRMTAAILKSLEKKMPEIRNCGDF